MAAGALEADSVKLVSPDRFLPDASPRERILLAAGLLATLALLLAHAAVYRFLCDDAFISFRYARNLSGGHGLVFNPGFERVEGYTNFLWVILLAGADLLGLAPEKSANLMSLAATAVLWGSVVWFVLRFPPTAGRRWLLLVPPLFLAATRSVAVWSTGGLETRLFEALVVAGVLRLVVEIEARLGDGERGAPGAGEGPAAPGRRAPAPVAALLLALATLTRPDGLLIAAIAFAVGGAVLLARRRLDLRVVAGGCVAYALPVGAHELFRRTYYGQWLPNTYYVKAGRTWWEMGFTYLGTCVLEYAAYLWIPLLVAAFFYHRSRRTMVVPLLFAAVVGGHALYVAAIGGDHFEYRPLDLYFPFLFLLIHGGAIWLAQGPAASLATAAGLGAILVGLVELPYQSHRQYPDRFLNGFPACSEEVDDCVRYLQPERDPIYRLPGLRWIAQAYRARLVRMAASFVGLRQERHRIFLASVASEGERLARLVRDGAIPRDAYFAISCVGAIPYLADLRVLDRFGLTDARVARSPSSGPLLMAHEKHATLDDARARGVDFWALDEAHSLWPISDVAFVQLLDETTVAKDPVYVADAGDGWYLLGLLPQGLEAASRRFPGLRFRPTGDRQATRPIFDAAIELHEERTRGLPDDRGARLDLANVLLYAGRFDEAIRAYGDLAASDDAVASLHLGLAVCAQGDFRRGAAAFREAIRLRPDYAAARYCLGMALVRLGELSEAAQALDQAARLRPYDVEAHLALGQVRLRLGDRAAAVEEHRILSGLDVAAAEFLASAIRQAGVWPGADAPTER